MKRTYDFATIGFRPIPETQEFVTIGVVALDAMARQFGFVLLEPQKTARILAMFPKVEKSLFREARAKLEEELTSIRNAVNGLHPVVDVPLLVDFRDKQDGLFAAITSPREGMFCFPVKGRRMATGMEDVLKVLNTRFIEQHTPGDQQIGEQEMARNLKNILRAARILTSYKQNATIGPASYQVTFAFAHLMDDNRADRAMRPLNLDLPTSTDIYNHGDEWIQKMRRLKRLGFRPERCLIATRTPRGDDHLRMEAFRQIREELLADEFTCIGESETENLLDFARIPPDSVLKFA